MPRPRMPELSRKERFKGTVRRIGGKALTAAAVVAALSGAPERARADQIPVDKKMQEYDTSLYHAEQELREAYERGDPEATRIFRERAKPPKVGRWPQRSGECLSNQPVRRDNTGKIVAVGIGAMAAVGAAGIGAMLLDEKRERRRRQQNQ